MKKISSFLLSISLLLISCNFFSQNGLSLDGANDYINCGTGTSLNITGTAITLEAWIYPTSWRTNIWQGNIISKEGNGTGYMLRVGAGGRLNMNVGNGPGAGTWNELSSSTTVLTLNTWQHIAGTYDGSYLRLYVNGIVTDSIAKTVTMTGSNTINLLLGTSPYDLNRTFPGRIDEVRIWNVARTKIEINNQMNSEMCTMPSSLKGYYTFNQGTAGGTNTTVTSATDLSGNTNTGTLTNFALTGTSSNWVTGKALTPGFVSSSIPVNTCGSYTMPDGRIITISGTYYDTLPSSSGCDSLIGYVINFSNAHIANTNTFSSCVTYSMPNGSIINASGTYYDTLSASGSCDTLDRYNITISASVNDSVYQTGNKLTSLDTWAPSHQWVNCNTGYSPISGETDKSYTPIGTGTGSYAVIVTRGSCVDTSDCFTVSINNMNINEKLEELYSIYPNPANESLYITSLINLNIKSVAIFDVTGKVILTETKNFNSVNISELSKGIYTLKLVTKNGSTSRRFVKN